MRYTSNTKAIELKFVKEKLCCNVKLSLIVSQIQFILCKSNGFAYIPFVNFYFAIPFCDG